MKTVAIPIFGDHISNRIDCCEQILLVTVANGNITDKQRIKLTENDADSFANLMRKLKVDVLICNGLPDAYSYLLDKENITIIQWKYGPVDEILTWFLNNYRQNQ